MFVEVALPVSLYRVFTYRLNKQIEPESLIGRRVLVPFRNLKYYGFITGVTKAVPDNIQIKDVLHIDDFNTFTEKEIKIITDISDFYVSPIGITAYYFAPDYLKGKKLQDPFYEKVFRLNLDTLPLKKLSKTKKQLIETVSNLGDVSFTQLKMLGFTKSTIQSLLKEGVLTEVSVHEVVYPLKQPVIFFEDNKKLSKAIYTLSFLPDLERLQTIVKYSKSLLEKGHSSLIILPSIVAVNEYYRFLSNYIPDVKVYHDALNPKKQLDIWLTVMKEPAVIIGTMSSLLIPAKNLKLISVEFEHSNSYRSLMTPKFDAKRVAYMVGKEKSATVIYADRLLSLESYMMLKSKRAIPLKDYTIPAKEIDIRTFNGFIKSLKSIEKILNHAGNTLIIANKSYYAAYIHCERCGFEWVCKICDIPMRVVIKDGTKTLKCPECGKEEHYSRYCPDCDNKLTEEGFGSHKLLDFLKNFDVSLYEDNRNTRIKILSSVEGKVIFESYNTVINIYPDFLQHLDRYDANEQFFRAVLTPLFINSNKYIIFSNIKPGSMLYKVLTDEESIVKVYEGELEFRQRFRYPPVEKYTKIEFWANKEETINQLKNLLMSFFKKDELRFEYQREKYYKAILKTGSKEILKEIYEKFAGRGKVSIEVNTKNI